MELNDARSDRLKASRCRLGSLERQHAVLRRALHDLLVVSYELASWEPGAHQRWLEVREQAYRALRCAGRSNKPGTDNRRRLTDSTR
jgi:hypothetical protein